jgi:hypothetical protein
MDTLLTDSDLFVNGLDRSGEMLAKRYLNYPLHFFFHDLLDRNLNYLFNNLLNYLLNNFFYFDYLFDYFFDLDGLLND